MIEKMITKIGDSNYASRSKINEIIDKVNEHLYEQDSLPSFLSNLDERMEKLEMRAILKPEYHPDDVSLNPIAKKGTFEWAIIQMKMGKRITRRHSTWNSYGFDKTDEGLCIDMVDYLAEDWEVVNEIQS